MLDHKDDFMVFAEIENVNEGIHGISPNRKKNSRNIASNW
jgi:hypothetical protein